ncbi:MAG: YifB family Mg chelatase-like AAA ATPase [Kyrpidia sp.]|nr:YifB family Mg chelatase-like AAA ATPase [Kyrpidia sp.]
MFARVPSVGLVGVEGRLVHVEVSIGTGLPRFEIVGLPGSEVREAKERVRAAIENSGYPFPLRRMTANLTPAAWKKEGSGWDLPLALAILAAAGVIPVERAARMVAVGELTLDGDVKDVRGMLPVARTAQRQGFSLICSTDSLGLVETVPDLETFPVRTLREAVNVIQGTLSPRTIRRATHVSDPEPSEDFADLVGMEYAKRACEIAAAGWHPLLLAGPPGSGKTALGGRMIGLLPPLNAEEAVEVANIHSAAHLSTHVNPSLRRPFRSPHHTISAPGLLGGGSHPRPGEVSLAHRGVLFLDEFPEFSRAAVEGLRQPLESREITVVRNQIPVTFPAQILFVAGANLCPCGRQGTDEPCRCSPALLQRYYNRMSAPILDRIDLFVEVARLRLAPLAQAERPESSRVIRARVERAWVRQQRRKPGCSFPFNAGYSLQDLQTRAPLSPAAGQLLEAAYHRMGLSTRAVYRIWRVARTIADLAGHTGVEREDVAEALQYRRRPGNFDGAQ